MSTKAAIGQTERSCLDAQQGQTVPLHAGPAPRAAPSGPGGAGFRPDEPALHS